MRQMILLWTIAGVISKITKTSLNLLVISSFKNNELEQDWGYIGRGGSIPRYGLSSPYMIGDVKM